jgi:hypothetical protein
MAVITIPVAWVNKVKAFDWGFSVEIAEDQRQKNKDSGEWETVDKTYYDLTVPADLGFDFAPGQRISVVGTFKTKKWEKGLNLIVRAQSVQAFQPQSQQPEEHLPF